MTHPLPVHIVSSAERAIGEAAIWWGKNRDKAPEAFFEELERGLQLISAQPEIGSKARNIKLAGIRRIHLSRIRYFLYYRVISSPESVEVIAFWHANRETEPSP